MYDVCSFWTNSWILSVGEIGSRDMLNVARVIEGVKGKAVERAELARIRASIYFRGVKDGRYLNNEIFEKSYKGF